MTEKKYKHLTVRELRDSGVLQEVNRRFFHPLGLALSVPFDENNQDCRAAMTIIDLREDPEGMIYGEEWLAQPSQARKFRARAALFSSVLSLRLAHREKTLGYGIEPLPDAPATDDGTLETT